MAFFELNQELIDGNPVPALCKSNAASSALWLWITSQVRKWDWKWEKNKKLTALLFMVVTQFFHWWFGFFPAESKECPVGVPWLYVACEQAKPSSFAGTTLWRGSGAGSGGAGWWLPLEGSEMTGAAEKQMGFLNSIATASLSAASGGPLSCCFHVFIHRNILVCESRRLVIP